MTNRKKIVFALLAPILILTVFIFVLNSPYWRKMRTEKVIADLSQMIVRHDLDWIGEHFDQDFVLSFENKNYDLIHLKDSLKANGATLKSMYIGKHLNSKDGKAVVLAWTQEWEVDYEVTFTKEWLFGYKISRISSDNSYYGTAWFKKLFIGGE